MSPLPMPDALEDVAKTRWPVMLIFCKEMRHEAKEQRKAVTAPGAFAAVAGSLHQA